MNSDELENDIMHAFDNLSYEEISKKVEAINPEDYSMSNRMARKRIEKKLMKRMEKKNGKRTISMKKVAYTAAAFGIIVGATVMVGDDVRAALEKVFAFVPNQGIVEVEVDSAKNKTTDVANQEQEATEFEGESVEKKKEISSDIYLLENSKTVEFSNFGLILENATVCNNKLTILYKLKLSALSKENENFDEESVIAAFENAGYRDYFTCNEAADVQNGKLVKSVNSVLSVNGIEKKAKDVNVMYSEDSGENPYVSEVFDLKDIAVDGADFTLKIADAEIPFSVQSVETYETAEEAANNKFVCEKDGMKLLFDVKQEENGKVYTDCYVLDSGKYDSVISLWPLAYDQDKYPYILVDGEKYQGCVVSDQTYNGQNGMPLRLSYEIGENVELSNYTVCIPSMMVQTDSDEITLALPSDISGFEKTKYSFDQNVELNCGAHCIWELEVFPSNQVAEEMGYDDGMQGDLCVFSIISENPDDPDVKERFYCFKEATADGQEVNVGSDVVSALSAHLNGPVEGVRNITFKKAISQLDIGVTFNQDHELLPEPVEKEDGDGGIG